MDAALLAELTPLYSKRFGSSHKWKQLKEMFEVMILPGNEATPLNGSKIYPIEGIEVVGTDSNKNKTYAFYGTDTSFFRACCPAGVKAKGFLHDGKIILR